MSDSRRLTPPEQSDSPSIIVRGAEGETTFPRLADDERFLVMQLLDEELHRVRYSPGLIASTIDKVQEL